MEVGQQCNFDEIANEVTQSNQQQQQPFIQQLQRIPLKSEDRGYGAKFETKQIIDSSFVKQPIENNSQKFISSSQTPNQIARSYSTASHYYVQAKQLTQQRQASTTTHGKAFLPLTSSQPSEFKKVRMTRSMYKIHQQKQLSQIGVCSNVMPHTKSIGSGLLRNDTLSRNNMSYEIDNKMARQKTLNQINSNSVTYYSSKQKLHDLDYLHSQKNIDSSQAMIPVILSTNEILKTTSSEDDCNFLNNTGSSDDIKKTILSRQGPRRRINQDFNIHITECGQPNINHEFNAYAHDTTFDYNASSQRTQSNRPSFNGRLQSNGIYQGRESFESSKRVTLAGTYSNQAPYLMNQKPHYYNRDSSYGTTKQNNTIDSPMQQASLIKRWSSRREEDEFESLTNIMITDQDLKKQQIKRLPYERNISQRSRNSRSQMSRSQNTFSRKKKQILNETEFSRAQPVVNYAFGEIPDFTEVKLKQQREQNMKLLSKQSSKETQRQLMNICQSSSSNKQIVLVEQPVFIGTSKKGSGLQRECAGSYGQIINSRSSMGQKGVFKYSMDLPLRLKQQMWRQHQIDKKNQQNGDLESALEIIGNNKRGDLSFNIDQAHIKNSFQTEVGTSPPAIYDNENIHNFEQTPYISIAQPNQNQVYEDRNNAYDSEKCSEDSPTNKSRRQSILTVNGLNQQSPMSKKKNKIIYSINKSSRNRNSMSKIKNGQFINNDVSNGTILRNSTDSKRSRDTNNPQFKYGDVRISQNKNGGPLFGLDGLMNVKSMNVKTSHKSTISSGFNMGRQVTINESNQLIESGGNSSIIASQDQNLEPRPYVHGFQNKLIQKRPLSNMSQQKVDSKNQNQSSDQDHIEIRDDDQVFHQSVETRKMSADPRQRNQTVTIQSMELEEDDRELANDFSVTQISIKVDQKNKSQSQGRQRHIYHVANNDGKSSISGNSIKMIKPSTIKKSKQKLIKSISSNKIIQSERKHTIFEESFDAIKLSDEALNIYQTLRLKKIETLTNILKSRAKSAQTRTKGHNLMQTTTMTLPFVGSSGNNLINTKELQSPAIIEGTPHQQMTIVLKGPDSVRGKEIILQTVKIDFLMNTLQAPDIDSMPELKLERRRSSNSKNVISKLQGRSISGSHQQSSPRIQPSSIEIISVVQPPPNHQIMIPLKDHESTITINDEDVGFFKDRTASHEFEMTAHYKKESSIIGDETSYQMQAAMMEKIVVKSPGRQTTTDHVMILDPNMSSMSQNNKKSQSNLNATLNQHSRRNSALGSHVPHDRDRRRSSQNMDLISFDEPYLKRSVLIKKNNCKNEMPSIVLIPGVSEKNTSKGFTRNYLKQSKSVANGRAIKPMELFAIDQLKKEDLKIAEITDLKQVQVKNMDLARHGRAPPSVIKKNQDTMKRNAESKSQKSRTGWTQENNNMLNTTTNGHWSLNQLRNNNMISSDLLSATFHVTPAAFIVNPIYSRKSSKSGRSTSYGTVGFKINHKKIARINNNQLLLIQDSEIEANYVPQIIINKDLAIQLPTTPSQLKIPVAQYQAQTRESRLYTNSSPLQGEITMNKQSNKALEPVLHLKHQISPNIQLSTSLSQRDMMSVVGTQLQHK